MTDQKQIDAVCHVLRVYEFIAAVKEYQCRNDAEGQNRLRNTAQNTVRGLTALTDLGVDVSSLRVLKTPAGTPVAAVPDFYVDPMLGEIRAALSDLKAVTVE
jgi:hypothetical protein